MRIGVISVFSRKFISLCSLVFCLEAGSLTVQAQEVLDSRRDTYENRTPAIIEMGLMTNFPDGQFHPERVLSRAQLATILVKTFGLDQRISEQENNLLLSDVPNNHWAFESIQLVLKNSILHLDEQGRFLPDQPVTRAAGLAAFAQAYGILYLSDAEISRILNSYPDSDRIPDWARRAIASAIFEDLVNIDSTNNRLNPDRLMTRADMVYTLSQYLAKQENPGTIPTIPLD
jgi:hypothetical protein